MIKSENPVALQQQKRTFRRTDHSTANDGKSLEPKKPDTGPPSSSRPESHDRISLGSQENMESERPKKPSSGTRPKKTDSSRSIPVRRKMASTAIEAESRSVREEDGEKDPSRSGSPSSTGTYNVGSPSRKSPAVGSPSSTGTYNIESPERRPVVEVPLGRKVSHSSGNVKATSLELEVQEESDVSNSEQSLPSRKSSVRVAPRAAPKKPPRSFIKEDDVLPGTSKHFVVESADMVIL